MKFKQALIEPFKGFGVSLRSFARKFSIKNIKGGLFVASVASFIVLPVLLILLSVYFFIPAPVGTFENPVYFPIRGVLCIGLVFTWVIYSFVVVVHWLEE